MDEIDEPENHDFMETVSDWIDESRPENDEFNQAYVDWLNSLHKWK